MAVPSPNLNEKSCESCGTSFRPNPRWAARTKLCQVCQVVRDNTRFRSRISQPRKCSSCSNEFFPIRANKSWSRCGHCSTVNLAKAVPCKLCEKVREPALLLKETCIGCVQSTAERRDEYAQLCINTAEQRRSETFSKVA